jgi:competence protein ComEA
MLQKFLNNYFGFNKQQRNGLYILCCISACLLIIRIAYPYFIKPADIQIANIAMVEEELEAKQNSAGNNGSEAKGALFPFDPNTVSEGELIKLGFKERTAQTFIKFRNKGFVFRQKEDVQKIYGISPKLYARIEPYILIKNSSGAKKDASTSSATKGKKISAKKLELNSADSLALIELKGVGPGFAKRILKYRGLLGGFVKIEQVKEIYGMTDELYALIAEQCSINASAIKKININTVDFKTLNKHPYINYELSKHIFNFKKNTPVSDANLADVIEDAESTARIRPYLEY